MTTITAPAHKAILPAPPFMTDTSGSVPEMQRPGPDDVTREPRQQGLFVADSFELGDPQQRLQQARTLQRLILSSPQVLPGDARLLSESAIAEGQAWQELMQQALKEKAMYAPDGSRPGQPAAATIEFLA